MNLKQTIFAFISLGLLFIPFSTGANSSFGVISFGIPFIAIAAYLVIIYLLTYDRISLTSNIKGIVFFSLFYVIVAFISSFLAPMMIPSFARASVNLLGFVIFIFILTLASSDSDQITNWQRRFSIALITSGTLMALYFILHLFYVIYHEGFIEVMLDRKPDGLMTLPWGTSNTIAATLIFPLIAAVVDIRSQKNFNYGESIAVSIMILAILATLSRTATIVIVCFFIVIAIISRRIKWLILIPIFIALVGIFLNYYEAGGLEKLYEARIEDTESITTMSGRAEIWKEFAQYIWAHPVEPIGYYGSLYKFGYSGHNIILTTTVEMGLWGLFIVAALFFNLFCLALKGIKSIDEVKKRVSIIFFVGLSAVLMNVLVEDPQYTQQYIIYFWVYIGILCLSCMPQRLNYANSIVI